MLITYETDKPTEKPFRYLWAKHVSGFTSSVHCARCLKGPYLKEFGLNMPKNEVVEFDFKPGDVIYFCGVSRPYRWENNLHLAIEVSEEAEDQVYVEAYNHDIIRVSHAIHLPFDDEIARNYFPDKSEAFLTCRNFQFGAQFFR